MVIADLWLRPPDVMGAAGHRAHGELGPGGKSHGRQHTADNTQGTTQGAARIFKTFIAAELDATEASDDTKKPLNGLSKTGEVAPDAYSPGLP